MKVFNLLLVICVCSLFSGCAGIEVPTPTQILKSPMGGGSLRLGMGEDKVRDVYGDPDTKTMVTSPEWKEPREEWFYSGRYSVLPVNAGYLSKDLYLYFDGDSLTNISKTSLGDNSAESE